MRSSRSTPSTSATSTYDFGLGLWLVHGLGSRVRRFSLKARIPMVLVMTHYDRVRRKRLGDVLVDEGIASRDAVIAALEDQQQSQRLLSDILLEMREVGEYDLARVVVEQYQVPYVDLSSYTLHRDLVQSLPAHLLRDAMVVPLERFGQQVCFACQEIPSTELADQLRPYAPGGMYFFAATSVDLRQALKDHTLDDEEEPAQPVSSPAAAGSEDGAWKELFDVANDAIVSNLDGSEEPAAEPEE